MFRNFLSVIYLGFAIFEAFQDVPTTCYVSQYALVLAYFGADTILLLQEKFKPDLESGVELLKQISNTSMLLLVAVYPINYIKTPTCMSSALRMLLFIYLVPIILVMIIAVVFLIGYFAYFASIFAYAKLTENYIKKQIVELLKKSLFDADALLEFYGRHSFLLQRMPLLDEEFAYYRDNFESEFQNAVNKFKSGECSICYDEFQPETKVVGYPRCFHLYHFQCLYDWLMKKKICAVCKLDFRISLALALKDRSQSGFIKVSRHTDQLMNPDNPPESKLPNSVAQLLLKPQTAQEQPINEPYKPTPVNSPKESEGKFKRSDSQEVVIGDFEDLQSPHLSEGLKFGETRFSDFRKKAGSTLIFKN